MINYFLRYISSLLTSILYCTSRLFLLKFTKNILKDFQFSLTNQVIWHFQ